MIEIDFAQLDLLRGDFFLGGYQPTGPPPLPGPAPHLGRHEIAGTAVSHHIRYNLSTWKRGALPMEDQGVPVPGA